MSLPATAPPINPEREQGDDPSLALGANPILPATGERWMPLPGEVGSEIEALARAALGGLLPPDTDPDFNLLDETDTTNPAEAATGSVLLEEKESKDDSDDLAVQAEPSPEPSTAAEAVARVDLPKPGHLEVACPTCSTTGLVPWDRLSGPLCCSGCWTWFRVGGNGQLTVVDPPTASHAAKKSLVPRPLSLAADGQRQGTKNKGLRTTGRIGAIVLALVPIVLMGALIYAGMRWWTKPRLAKLPQELDRRAQLLVESWLKHDTQTMVRLAHPHYRGPTRRWAHDHRSPVPPGRFDRRKAAIQVRILSQDEKTADAEVRVDLSGSPEPIVLRQHWESLESGWFFKPANDPLARAPEMVAPPATKKRAR